MLRQSITNTDIELIRITVENYRRGCAKPIQVTPETSGDTFGQRLQALTETRLPPTEKFVIGGNARNQGLIATRQGNLMAAEQAFAMARAPLKLSKLSPESSLLYQSFLEQAEAYLDYRRGNFEQARNRTSEAMAIDVVLEEEYGYDILLLHRIYLAHNLIRIDAQCKYFDSAIELAFQILSYLEGISEVLPLPGPWGRERVARQSPELVAGMFVEITNEIALILVGKDRSLVRDLLVSASAHLLLKANTHDHCHPRAYTWLLVKQAFASNDVATFLKRASHFFSEGRADIPLLWYATVIDLVTLCDELAVSDSELFRQEVAREAGSWKNLPQKFSSILVCPKIEETQESDTLTNSKPGKALST
ncbi:hypothetical protein BV378_05125 [Nostoc sp. RF31YmG]|nr:hypothetical protein BV378_05125 [Nostoc sp. RF31YmG]